jgi:hypothetical protein
MEPISDKVVDGVSELRFELTGARLFAVDARRDFGVEEDVIREAEQAAEDCAEADFSDERKSREAQRRHG